ncbi:hypothetical protein [Streptomyces sp. AM 2-1-1]|uniref:hypothetical protein n=1 Tax=Streptomyces sp. AM 2-1-1 TaxID=3028709 RepID=UPI0023B9BBE4|nr:hypothetical protein [Streptomyces sp. AM 2-1-1]WEH41579.1 hypothetical protein PZB77_19910 [Streptomyces sp. AM 2-1-1]
MTIELDGLGRQVSELKAGPGTAEAADGPVFVDESGRRSKNFRRAGWLVAAGCAAFATVLVASLLGGSAAAPWLPLTSQEQKKDAEKSAEAPTADPSGASAVLDVDDPAATTGPTPSASATGAAAPGAADVSANTSARPSATGPAASPSATEAAVPATTGGGGTTPKPSASAPAPTQTTEAPVTDPVDPPDTDPGTTDPTTEPPVTPESSIP